ncbi:MAG: 4'-phosphopantetheinyl transferase superfamily protein [Eubacteriales bacterium]
MEKDEKGKPYLAGYPHIHISISHSGPYIACAFGDKPVGVDVEMWKAHPKWRRIVDKLHPREREELLQSCGGTISGDTEEPVREFCGLWVRKESFLKAIGEGLRVPLDAFDTTGEWVSRSFRRSGGGAGSTSRRKAAVWRSVWSETIGRSRIFLWSFKMRNLSMGTD